MDFVALLLATPNTTVTAVVTDIATAAVVGVTRGIFIHVAVVAFFPLVCKTPDTVSEHANIVTSERLQETRVALLRPGDNAVTTYCFATAVAAPVAVFVITVITLLALCPIANPVTAVT